jgi:hypothetical protein
MPVAGRHKVEISSAIRLGNERDAKRSTVAGLRILNALPTLGIRP